MRLVPLIVVFLLALPAAALLAMPRDEARPPAPRPAETPQPSPRPAAPREELPPVREAEPDRPRPRSRAAGQPRSGRLVNGRPLPAQGPGYVTWDPIRKQLPNRSWRRWGTGRLLRTVERVLAAYARRHPDEPPVLVGDL